MFETPLFNRRLFLQGLTGAAIVAECGLNWAQAPKATNPSGLIVAQIADLSTSQQDVSKDFLTGFRAAWQDINSRGGLRGKTVQHLVLETDGTAEGLRAALNSIRDNPACVVLSGSTGDLAAVRVIEQLPQMKFSIAHAAPWLQSSNFAIDEQTFPIFSGREQQLTHALRTVSLMGLKELGAVYASAQEYLLHHQEVERIATKIGLKLLSLRGTGNLSAMGQQLTPSTPAILLFLGGTPELAQFTQGLEKQARQRYIVALAEVDLPTMLQMGGSRNTPIIATQSVPLVNSSLPIVRAYRETLARLFDEPPVSLSLAGFIAARYTYEVLKNINGAVTRQSTLAEFQRRAELDIGGFRVSFDAQRRSAAYVTQSMTASDGRLIG